MNTLSFSRGCLNTVSICIQMYFINPTKNVLGYKCIIPERRNWKKSFKTMFWFSTFHASLTFWKTCKIKFNIKGSRKKSFISKVKEKPFLKKSAAYFDLTTSMHEQKDIRNQYFKIIFKGGTSIRNSFLRIPDRPSKLWWFF